MQRTSQASGSEVGPLGPGLPLFTIGYERLRPALLIDALQAAGVRLLVDVRAVAASRRPGFAKTALRLVLAEAGIGYLHLRALGTPAEGRAAARAGRTAEMQMLFTRHLAGVEAQAALGELAGVARARPTALLCVEAEACHCHRALVADAMAAAHGFRRVDLDLQV